jgi:putative RNA 2'-phosphotransferase
MVKNDNDLENRRDRLNRYQTNGLFHPYTCGSEDCRDILTAEVQSGQLVLVCPSCDYRQTKIHMIPSEELMKSHDNIRDNLYNRRNIKISKYLSKILRHQPERIGLVLDENGWAVVDELISKSGMKMTPQEIEEVVRTNDKQRFSFNEDKSKIRANQGHSIEVDVELEELTPPEILYHGTATKNLDAIHKNGLLSMNRLYVHMTDDFSVANKTGGRHGNPIVLSVNTTAMLADGLGPFFKSKNGVWLTKEVPSKYLIFPNAKES